MRSFTLRTTLSAALIWRKPASTAALPRTAFELACADLRVFAGDQRGREIIAARIIDLARNGVTDPAALHRRIIAEARVSI
jgi:hypothetical protein